MICSSLVDTHFSGLSILESEHSNAMSAKLASALSSLRQVLEFTQILFLPYFQSSIFRTLPATTKRAGKAPGV